MADISNKFLAILIGVSFLISLIGFYSLEKTGFTGLATTTTGTVKLNITPTASLNVTQTSVDFGNSSIQNNKKNCTLTTESTTQSPAGCWGATYATGGFRFVNTGSVQINVTIHGTKINSTSFFGTTGGKYLFRCVCAASANCTAVQTTYIDLNTTSKLCLRNLNFPDGSDGATTHINITIPESATGFKNDTVTFTASRACTSAC